MKLSIVIVNYNVKYFLEQCLCSVYKAMENIDSELFVVDNNSTDGSQEMVSTKFPKVHLIANKENVGFARANNQALKMAQGEYVLLLNPDTIIQQDTLQKCIDFMDKTKDAGGLGVKMINGKGEFLPESKRGLPLPNVAFYKIFGLSKLFPKSKRFGSYHLTYLDNDEIHPVEVLSGACMMIRKSVLDLTGYLDEDYFMYGEDIDLSYRILKTGNKNYYFPKTRIIHYKGESTKKGTLNYVFVFYRAMQIFAKKHFSQKNARLFNWLINFAIWFRASLALIKRIAISLLLPILDFAIIYAGMLALSQYWEDVVLAPRDSAFPQEYKLLVIPIYILIWLLATFFFRGYQKPIQLSRTNKGIIAGTIAILLVYALLPESFRYSRAIIIFGAMWTVIAMNTIRYILHKLNIRKYMLGAKENRRIVIVGSLSEAKKIRNLVHALYQKTQFTGIVTLSADESSDNLALGSLSQINDIIPLYKINEVLFCSNNLESDQIIDLICKMNHFQVDFKIASQEGNSIIGSNSINTTEELFSHWLHPISKKENRLKKRAFDFAFSMLLLLSLPFNIWFVTKKNNYCKNIFSVLTGNKSWVGYCPEESENLPPLKKGVLYPTDAQLLTTSDRNMLRKLNVVYVQDYQIKHDLHILWKGFKYAGR